MRLWPCSVAAIAALLPLHAIAQPPCTDQLGNGTIGVYADAAGTQQCISAPLLPEPQATVHVIAKLAGASAAGILGAEFRIEVAREDGSAPGAAVLFGWTVNPAAQFSIGNPLDLTPQDPNDPQGANIVFSTCQMDPLTAQVSLGTITIINLGPAMPLTMKVKQKTPPSNPGFPFALFTACDPPVFTKIPITPPQNELGREAIASFSYVNHPTCLPCSAPQLGIFADSLPGLTPLCAEPLMPTTFHLVGSVPGTQPPGLTGGDFRIEVANAAGYFFTYFPPSGGTFFGSPFDLTPNDPNDATGTTVQFDQCQPAPMPSPGSPIDFGRIVVFNNGSGRTTQLRIRRMNPPADPGQPCARFFLCDTPFFSPVCMSGAPTADLVYETTLYGAQCGLAPFITETLELDTHAAGDDGDAGPVSTTQVMDHRKQFLITVQGNLSMWPSTSWIAPPNVLCGVPDRSVLTPSPGVTNYWAGADAMVTFAVPLPPGGNCNDLEGLGYPRNPGRFQMDLGTGFTSPTPLGGLIADPSPGHLYKFLVTGGDAVGTFRWLEAVTSDNYGVLTITVEEAAASDVTVATPPRRIRMLGNVPDPFNPMTRVRYELPAATDVTVEVFDVRSRLVRSLFRGVQPAGTREVEWDGRSTDGLSLPSGCYFVRIASPQGEGVERVTLVR